MDSELEIFKKQGFGHSLGLGERPSLCIVDFVVGFDDAEALGGGNIHAAIEQTVVLLDFCRTHDIPIAHTRVVFADDGSDHNLLSDKVPSLKELTETAPKLSDRSGPHANTRPSWWFANAMPRHSFKPTMAAGWRYRAPIQF